MVVFAGSVPPGLDDDCYAQHDPASCSRWASRSSSTPTAIRCVWASRPVRTTSSPSWSRPRRSSAMSSPSMEDRIAAARRMREMGAGSVVITFRYRLRRRAAIDGDAAARSSARCPTWTRSRRWAGATLWWAGTRSSSLDGESPERVPAFRPGLRGRQPHPLRGGCVLARRRGEAGEAGGTRGGVR